MLEDRARPVDRAKREGRAVVNDRVGDDGARGKELESLYH